MSLKVFIYLSARGNAFAARVLSVSVSCILLTVKENALGSNIGCDFEARPRHTSIVHSVSCNRYDFRRTGVLES